MDNESIEEFLKKLPQNSISITAISPGAVNSRKTTPAKSRIPNCSISVKAVNRETGQEDDAVIIRRFHDAQRMARFRAKKKKTIEDQQVQIIETNRFQPIVKKTYNETEKQRSMDNRLEALAAIVNNNNGASSPETESKYAQLLTIIERLGRDVRLSYAGSRTSAERLKSGIARARCLVKDCLIETRINLRQ